MFQNIIQSLKIILLVITDDEKLHCLAVKNFLALLYRITSKYNEDFYCLNWRHSLRTENKLKEYENVCKNYDYHYIEMPKEESVLKHNPGGKSKKIPFIIYIDMECLLDKIDTCHSSPEKSSTTKIDKYSFWLFVVYTLFI